MISATRFSFIVEKVEKTFNFTQKWLDHLLLMTSYLVTLETDHHWTWLKMRATDEQTVIETSGADVLSSRKKLRKTLGGVASTSPLVRPRVNRFSKG